MESGKNKIYFPGLNGLRFLAALLVILHHIEFVKAKLGFPNFMNIVFFQRGHLGVTLFFVLSGFLITYLLFDEQKRNNKILLRKFYLRRILRIWPLYYLVVFILFFILFINTGSDHQTLEKLFFYIIILPNAVNALYPLVDGIYHLWTIGVEEQFYVIWPLAIKYIKHHILKICIVVTFFFPVVRLALFYFYKNFSADSFYVSFCNIFLTLQFESMAIGGIGAYILFNNKIFMLNIIYSKTVQIATYGMIVYYLGFSVPDFYFNSVFISLLFILLILNVASNSSSLLKFENDVLNYLGKISYGLYVYHLLVILITLKVIQYNTGIMGLYDNILLYSVSILGTIAIAGLSFYYFEQKFLTIKNTLFSR